MRHGQALQLEDVAETRGDQQADTRTLALDQRIGGDRAAVCMDGAMPSRAAQLQRLLDFVNAAEDAGARAGWRARHFEAVQLTGFRNESEVGERAADICAENA